MNAAPKEYDISPGARAALAKIFHLEYDLYNFLKQRLIGQVTEVCMPYKTCTFDNVNDFKLFQLLQSGKMDPSNVAALNDN